VTSVYAGIIGIMQNDIKRVVAYSTASQMGYIIMTNGIGHYSIGLNHIINHAYFKALLFLSSGNIIHSDNNEQDLRRYGKLILRLPMTSICIIIGTINILGLPYLSGYYSKDVLLEYSIGTFRLSGLNVYILGIISAMGTTIYSMRIIKRSMIITNSNEYKNVNESNGIIGILSMISIISGYMINESIEDKIGIEEIDTHESINIIIKLLPIFCVVISIIIGLTYEI
jgi:NADH-ubiquinone oxidoreductase chain 5